MLAGCDHHTVKRYVERHDAGLPPDGGIVRVSIIDGFRPKIDEWVERSHGGVRADVVHDKLVASCSVPLGAMAWSRFRIVIPVWDRTTATTLSCLDETFTRIGGIATYTLTDDEKTIAAMHIAGVPVRHPDMVAAGRHHGAQIVPGVPADPESRAGSEAAVKIAKADLAPPDANVLDACATFAELRAEAAMCCETVNHREHRETRRVPAGSVALPAPVCFPDLGGHSQAPHRWRGGVPRARAGRRRLVPSAWRTTPGLG